MFKKGALSRVEEAKHGLPWWLWTDLRYLSSSFKALKKQAFPDFVFRILESMVTMIPLTTHIVSIWAISTTFIFYRSTTSLEREVRNYSFERNLLLPPAQATKTLQQLIFKFHSMFDSFFSRKQLVMVFTQSDHTYR